MLAWLQLAVIEILKQCMISATQVFVEKVRTLKMKNRKISTSVLKWNMGNAILLAVVSKRRCWT